MRNTALEANFVVLSLPVKAEAGLKGFYFSGMIANEWYAAGSGYNKDIKKDELLGTSLALLCNSGIYFNGGT